MLIHERNAEADKTVMPAGLVGVGVCVGNAVFVGDGCGVLVGVSEGLTVGEAMLGECVGEFVTVGEINPTVGDGVSDSEGNAVLVHTASVSLAISVIVAEIAVFVTKIGVLVGVSVRVGSVGVDVQAARMRRVTIRRRNGYL